MTTKPLLFYDLEVFSHDYFAIFMNRNKEVVAKFHNTCDGMYELVKNNRLVAYNNHHYDDPVLSKMMNGWTPYQLKDLNDRIIKYGEEHKRNISPLLTDSLDTMQQITVGSVGLKQIMGNMGKSIVESSVSFDIDRPLTPQEVEDTFYYNTSDTSAVVDVYNIREERYFNTKARLIELLKTIRKVPDNVGRWNTTTIVANILTNSPMTKWSSLRVPEHMFNLVPTEVKDMWLEHARLGMDGKRPTTTIREWGLDIVFGFGGLHAAPSKYKEYSNVILYDVASMYPSIIILLNALGSSTGIYADLKKQRLQAKAEGDKARDGALKLILNSTYGLLNNQYSMLNNPLAAYTVCIYGQIALYRLMQLISPHGELVQANTDGVAYVPFSVTDERLVRDVIIPQWEQEFSLDMEEKRYDQWFQRDVNNYVAVIDRNKGCVAGNVEVKGGDVKKAFYDDYFGNNSTRIVDVAIVKHLIDKQDILTTLQQHVDEPLLFQYTLKGGNTFVGIKDKDGNEYQKVNRVFAVKSSVPHVLLQKYRGDGTYVSFPDAPERMGVHNGPVEDYPLREMIDWTFYYQLIKRKLEAWG